MLDAALRVLLVRKERRLVATQEAHHAVIDRLDRRTDGDEHAPDRTQEDLDGARNRPDRSPDGLVENSPGEAVQSHEKRARPARKEHVGQEAQHNVGHREGERVHHRPGEERSHGDDPVGAGHRPDRRTDPRGSDDTSEAAGEMQSDVSRASQELTKECIAAEGDEDCRRNPDHGRAEAEIDSERQVDSRRQSDIHDLDEPVAIVGVVLVGAPVDLLQAVSDDSNRVFDLLVELVERVAKTLHAQCNEDIADAEINDRVSDHHQSEERESRSRSRAEHAEGVARGEVEVVGFVAAVSRESQSDQDDREVAAQEFLVEQIRSDGDHHHDRQREVDSQTQCSARGPGDPGQSASHADVGEVTEDLGIVALVIAIGLLIDLGEPLGDLLEHAQRQELVHRGEEIGEVDDVADRHGSPGAVAGETNEGEPGGDGACINIAYGDAEADRQTVELAFFQKLEDKAADGHCNDGAARSAEHRDDPGGRPGDEQRGNQTGNRGRSLAPDVDAGPDREGESADGGSDSKDVAEAVTLLERVPERLRAGQKTRSVSDELRNGRIDVATDEFQNLPDEVGELDQAADDHEVNQGPDVRVGTPAGEEAARNPVPAGISLLPAEAVRGPDDGAEGEEDAEDHGNNARSTVVRNPVQSLARFVQDEPDEREWGDEPLPSFRTVSGITEELAHSVVFPFGLVMHRESEHHSQCGVRC